MARLSFGGYRGALHSGNRAQDERRSLLQPADPSCPSSHAPLSCLATCCLPECRAAPIYLECRGTYCDGGQRQRQLSDPERRACDGIGLGEEVDKCHTLW